MDNIREEILPTTSAVKKQLIINPGAVRSTLQLIGDVSTSEILIQSPLVAEPDEDTDADWQQLTIEEVDIKLTATNMAYTFYGSLLIRINKPVTTNEVGVFWII